MKTPYFNLEQRTLIYANTLQGHIMLVNLSFNKLIREALKHPFFLFVLIFGHPIINLLLHCL